MGRILTIVLGLLGVALLGFAGYRLARDLWRAVDQPPAPSVANQIAQAALASVATPAQGWFPCREDPLFSWEGELQGWLLESDAPQLLAPATGDEAAEAESQAPDSAAPAKLGVSYTRARHGKSCLSVPVAFPDPATVFCRAGALAGVRFISYDVYVPEAARGYVGCLFFLKDKDGRWYQARCRAPLKAGAWSTVTADLRGGSPDIEPLGHLGQWDENQASGIATAGLTFYGDQAYRGEVWVDNFRGWMRADRFLRLAAPSSAGAARVPEARRAEWAALKAEAEKQREPPLTLLNLRTDPAPDTSAAAPEVPVFRTLTVRFELNRQVANPFDPEQADITATVETPSGRRHEVPGFWYQDFEAFPRFAAEEVAPVGRPEWRVRVTPREPGEHRVTVRARLSGGKEEAGAPALSFRAVASPERGFVRVSKRDPYWFEFDNGEFFYPVGHNIHSPIDIRCWTRIYGRQPPLRRGLTMYEDFFPKMRAAGQNLGEVWMASWWLGIEWTRRWPNYHGAGRYSLERAWMLDRLLDLAREHGILLHVVIDNHGKFSSWCDEEWSDNPYSSASAGDRGWLDSADEFFTNPRSRELHKRRMRYIAARWASHPSILGWEVVSEYDLVGARYQDGARYYRSPEGREWVREMAETLRRHDPYGHLITNHYSGDFNKVDAELAVSPTVDYVVGDGYRQQPGFVRMALEGSRYWTQIVRKPFWVTEYGGNWSATSKECLRADLHAGLWSTWVTQYAGTPLFWWYDFIDRENLYPHFRAFANYIAGEDRRGLAGKTDDLALSGAGADSLRGLQYRWPDGAYVWIYNLSVAEELRDRASLPRHDEISARFAGLTPGEYRVEIWNTWTGKRLDAFVRRCETGELEVRLPPFEGDVALKVKRANAVSAPARGGSGDPAER